MSPELIIQLIADHPFKAQCLLFFVLLLAGLNLPVSEDIVVVIGGVLASTFIPDHTLGLFAAVLVGAYTADSMVYWTGRLFAPRLVRLPIIRRLINPVRLLKVQAYYARYGAVTLFVGRFIPFGVRNCLFMAAGLTRLPYRKFLLVDGMACLLSNSLLFWTAYAFGQHYKKFAEYLEVIDLLIFAGFLVALFALIWYKKSKRAAAK